MEFKAKYETLMNEYNKQKLALEKIAEKRKELETSILDSMINNKLKELSFNDDYKFTLNKISVENNKAKVERQKEKEQNKKNKKLEKSVKQK